MISSAAVAHGERPSSSVGQSTGFLNRVSEVRTLSGAPFRAPTPTTHPEPAGAGPSPTGTSEHGKEPRFDLRALQARGLHLPLLRDLRRPQRLLGLRPHGLGAQAQHPRRLVALHRPVARGRRRPRRHDHHEPAHLGGLRPRRRLRRPDGRLQGLQEAPPRRPALRGAGPQADPGGQGLEAPRGLQVHRVRLEEPHRAALVQPDVQDLRRPGRGRLRGRLPPPRDRPGDLRAVPQHRPDVAQESPLRRRAVRQVLPQRDQPAQLHVPLARVRADGAGVLHPPGRGGGAHLRARRHARGQAGPERRAAGGLGLGGLASNGTASRAFPSPTCTCTGRPRRSSRTTPAPASTSSTPSPSASRSSRASPRAPTSTSRSTRSSPASR